MFPIPFNFPFRKRDGSLTTIEKATTYTLIGDVKSTDVDKKVVLPKNTKTLLLVATRASYDYFHVECVIDFDDFLRIAKTQNNTFIFSNYIYTRSGDNISSANHAAVAFTYNETTRELALFDFKYGSSSYSCDFKVYII